MQPICMLCLSPNNLPLRCYMNAYVGLLSGLLANLTCASCMSFHEYAKSNGNLADVMAASAWCCMAILIAVYVLFLAHLLTVQTIKMVAIPAAKGLATTVQRVRHRVQQARQSRASAGASSPSSDHEHEEEEEPAVEMQSVSSAAPPTPMVVLPDSSTTDSRETDTSSRTGASQPRDRYGRFSSRLRQVPLE